MTRDGEKVTTECQTPGCQIPKIGIKPEKMQFLICEETNSTDSTQLVRVPEQASLTQASILN